MTQKELLRTYAIKPDIVHKQSFARNKTTFKVTHLVEMVQTGYIQNGEGVRLYRV